MSALSKALTENRVYRSLVRHGFPSDNRNRALAVHSNLFLHVHPIKVRLRAIAFKRTLYLGGLSAAAFLLLTITGVLLMFYYRPSVPQAYHDMKDLEFVVSFGLFLRNLHRFAAHAMVALVFLHLVLTFYRGAYRQPREFNWVLGVGLFVATVLLSYTGYLLPWDQLAFWAVTVGTKMAEAAPVVGEKLRFLLLGGTEIGENALIRFYVLHCLALPLLAFFGIAVHIWRIRKDGGIYLGPAENAPPQTSAPHRPEPEEKEALVMTWPHLMMRELVAFLALTLVLVVVSLALMAPLEAMANPLLTPNPAKAPWYFLGLQELLHYYPPLISGVALPALMLLALVAVPYFDTNTARAPMWEPSRGRRLAQVWGVMGVLSLVLYVAGAHPVWPMIVPLWAVGALMTVAAFARAPSPTGLWLRRRSLPFWVFSWFVAISVVLTIVGIFFRGPNWSLTLPWRDGIF